MKPVFSYSDYCNFVWANFVVAFSVATNRENSRLRGACICSKSVRATSQYCAKRVWRSTRRTAEGNAIRVSLGAWVCCMAAPSTIDIRQCWGHFANKYLKKNVYARVIKVGQLRAPLNEFSLWRTISPFFNAPHLIYDTSVLVCYSAHYYSVIEMS